MDEHQRPVLIDELRDAAAAAAEEIVGQPEPEFDPELGWHQLHAEIAELAVHVARAAQTHGVPFDHVPGHRPDVYTVEMSPTNPQLHVGASHEFAFRISPDDIAFERQHAEHSGRTADDSSSDFETVSAWEPVPISELWSLTASGDILERDDEQVRVLFEFPPDMQIDELRTFLVNTLGKFAATHQLDI